MASGVPTTVTDARTREILRRLELDITRRLDGLLRGDHRGLVPGHGSELGETRQYAPGDDVRRMDWNVTARLQSPHIRETIAERELETWLVIDRSARLDFGTAGCEKRDLVLAAAGAAGFLTSRDGNRIGALIVGRPEPLIIPARGSRRHLLHILHSIAESPRIDGGGATDLARAVERAGTLAKRRGLMVIISDFHVEPGWISQVRGAATKHDVLAIEVVDPSELELPNVGLLTVVDPATGEERDIPTHKPKVRRLYADAAASRRHTLATELHSARVDHLTLRTDQPWLDDLVMFLGRRKERIVALAGSRR
ncbi:MAG: hypothetical protein ACI8TP_003798 [Acidimicrobiales bacterium]